MMAWVSPLAITRSTPRRIGFGAFLVSTVNVKSRISSVAMCSVPLERADGGVDVDEHALAVDGQGVDGHGPRRGQPGRRAGAQVEPGAVQPALDGAALDLPVRQRHGAVRADVADGVPVAVLAADHRDLDGTGLALELDAQRAAGGDVGGVAGQLGAHPRPSDSSADSTWGAVAATGSGTAPSSSARPVAAGSAASRLMLVSSSRSIAVMSRSSMSGMPIWWMSSAKK